MGRKVDFEEELNRLPLGLALLAIDLPILRDPLARFLAFINRKLAPQAS